jgi:hypothetical protein
MPFRLLRSRTERPSSVAPYSRLLCVKLKSGKTCIVSSELLHLLPQGDEVLSILSANGRPIFATMEPVKRLQPRPARQVSEVGGP